MIFVTWDVCLHSLKVDKSKHDSYFAVKSRASSCECQICDYNEVDTSLFNVIFDAYFLY